MSKKNTITWVLSAIIVIVVLVVAEFFIKTNLLTPENTNVVNLNNANQEETKSAQNDANSVSTQQETPKSITERISPEIQEQISKEQEKILALNGTVEKIETRTLSVRINTEEKQPEKIYQVTLTPKAKIMLTKINPETGSISTSDLSLSEIKTGDEIIVWSKEDLRNKTEFESEYLEVISR